MAPNEAQRACIEANRRRYEELKAAGQASRALPPPTALENHPIAGIGVLSVLHTWRATRPAIRRTVALTVTAHSQGAPGTESSNPPAPIPQAPQSSAPVPVCNELIF
jgi:hypothetical protein